MAYEHESIIRAQYQQLAEERARAYADLEAGRVSEDQYTTMDAGNRILEADMKRAALDNIAHKYVSSQQQPRGNQFGLNQDEVDIANGIAGGDQTITNEQRQRAYAQNKERLRYMRATGAYRDDQGTTR
jgi:hypothetical protein